MAVTDADTQRRELQQIIEECNEQIREGLDKANESTVYARRNAAIDELKTLDGGKVKTKSANKPKPTAPPAVPDLVATVTQRFALVGFNPASISVIVGDLRKKYAGDADFVAASENIIQAQAKAKGIDLTAPHKEPEQLAVEVEKPADPKPPQPSDWDWGDDTATDAVVADDSIQTTADPAATAAEATTTDATTDTTPDDEWQPPEWTVEQQQEINALRSEFGLMRQESLNMDLDKERQREAADQIVAEMLYIGERAAAIKRDYEARYGRITKYLDYLEKLHEHDLMRYGRDNKVKDKQYCALPSGRISFTTRQGHFKMVDPPTFKGELLKLPKVVQAELKITKRTEELIHVEYPDLDAIYAWFDKKRAQYLELAKQLADLKEDDPKRAKIQLTMDQLALPKGLIYEDTQTTMKVKPNTKKGDTTDGE